MLANEKKGRSKGHLKLPKRLEEHKTIKNKKAPNSEQHNAERLKSFLQTEQKWNKR